MIMIIIMIIIIIIVRSSIHNSKTHQVLKVSVFQEGFREAAVLRRKVKQIKFSLILSLEAGGRFVRYV